MEKGFAREGKIVYNVYHEQAICVCSVKPIDGSVDVMGNKMEDVELENHGIEKRHQCKCCGYYTLVGTEEDIMWDICPVCFWENDVFRDNPEIYSGANHETLAQGRENYRKYSACDPRFVDSVRLPLLQELPENDEKTGDKVSTAENELG